MNVKHFIKRLRGREWQAIFSNSPFIRSATLASRISLWRTAK